MVERRLNTRRKTFLGARLHYHQQSADGVIRNLGRHGARIVFKDAATVHDEFDVEVARLDQRLRARVTWRRTNELGVAFLGEAANVRTIVTPDLTPDPVVRLQALEQPDTDTDRLRQRIAQVTSAR